VIDIVCSPMFNKHTTALYAVVISSIVVASVFAIGFVQQALAQGNQSSAGNQTSGGGAGGGSNKTSGAPGSNRASGNATSGGTAAGGSTGGGPPY
jgi:uncharacterized membrane protein